MLYHPANNISRKSYVKFQFSTYHILHSYTNNFAHARNIYTFWIEELSLRSKVLRKVKGISYFIHPAHSTFGLKERLLLMLFLSTNRQTVLLCTTGGLFKIVVPSLLSLCFTPSLKGLKLQMFVISLILIIRSTNAM